MKFPLLNGCIMVGVVLKLKLSTYFSTNTIFPLSKPNQT